jgi:hypothetical protein
MAEIQDKVMSEQMKRDLREFLDGYGEPSLGHYIPNLIWDNEPTFHKRLDPYYYQAQGQEVPQAPSKPWYKQPEIVVMIVAISAIWIVLAFYPY